MKIQNIQLKILWFLILKKKSLDKFIGDIIIKEYKKEDTKTQQIWTTDVSRLSFLVRQILNETEKVWMSDKKGTCLLKMIIKPMQLVIQNLIFLDT